MLKCTHPQLGRIWFSAAADGGATPAGMAAMSENEATTALLFYSISTATPGVHAWAETGWVSYMVCTRFSLSKQCLLPACLSAEHRQLQTVKGVRFRSTWLGQQVPTLTNVKACAHQRPLLPLPLLPVAGQPSAPCGLLEPQPLARALGVGRLAQGGRRRQRQPV